MAKKPSIVSVLGAGNFGTAFAQILAENGHRVHLWNWEQDHAPLKEIETYHENRTYLPGVKLLKQVVPTYQIDDALRGVEAVFVAVPSVAMESTISFAARHIPSTAAIVNLSKGFHTGRLEPITDIIARHVTPALRKHIVAISGPAVAVQLVHHHVTVMNVASKNRKMIERVQMLVENPFVKLIPTTDVIGVEVGGLCKNIYSILMGICDGMGVGLNTKAALMTEAVKEMSLLTKALGGKRETAYELAGLGDLIGTSFAPVSRNRRFGECLGNGKTVAEAKQAVGQTVEGVAAAACAHALQQKHGITLPIATLIYQTTQPKAQPVKLVEKYISRVLCG